MSLGFGYSFYVCFQALESVEEAVLRLEKLLQELNLSSASCGKEQLKAACSDLEKISKLKKEAEFLEASFRAKADSLQQVIVSCPNLYLISCVFILSCCDCNFLSISRYSCQCHSYFCYIHSGSY